MAKLRPAKMTPVAVLMKVAHLVAATVPEAELGVASDRAVVPEAATTTATMSQMPPPLILLAMALGMEAEDETAQLPKQRLATVATAVDPMRMVQPVASTVPQAELRVEAASTAVMVPTSTAATRSQMPPPPMLLTMSVETRAEKTTLHGTMRGWATVWTTRKLCLIQINGFAIGSGQ